MIALYNTEILEMLLAFRKNPEDIFPTDLIPLLLNHSTNIDLTYLDNLLYYEKNQQNSTKRKKQYTQIIKEKMSWQPYNNKLRLQIISYNDYPNSIKDFFNQFTTNKKRLSLLDYCKKINIDENKKVENVRFQPIKNTVKIPKNKRFTFRCNKDIVKACRLTYIKFHDQLRPPTYCHLEKEGNRNSLKKLDIDYEFDSDCEWIVEEGESVDSETRSVDDHSSITEEWIEKDSGEVEKRGYKKPEIEIIDVPFVVLKEISNEFELPLLKRDDVPEELVCVLKEKLQELTRNEAEKRFGYEFRIHHSAVKRKVNEILSEVKVE